MKVYLAAPWARRLEVGAVAGKLTRLGVEVTGKWYAQADTKENKKLVENAYADLRAIRECDALVRFTDIGGSSATGGKDFETGYAFALGRPIYVVGGRQNIFDYLPNFIHVKDEAELLRLLSPVEIM